MGYKFFHTFVIVFLNAYIPSERPDFVLCSTQSIDITFPKKGQPGIIMLSGCPNIFVEKS